MRMGRPRALRAGVLLEKIRMNEAGYVKAGPCRPPYFLIPEAFAEGAREAGRRWARIARKYGPSR